MISDQKDYSVRAVKKSMDETGTLTDAFNDMLVQIQEQTLALNGFNYKLEQKVKERTVQLEALNKELEAFSYSISHDLRAPLRGIVGFVTILEEDYSSRLDDEAKRITGVIRSNTLKMGRLIDDLLTFARMGRKDIEKTVISTEAMIQEVVREIAPEDKNGHIQWVIGPLPDVTGDINAMRQVWINLISNAVKYSANKETPRIEIGFIALEGENVFFVKDNGVGFDEKYKDKLFKVFQRLHSAEDFEGTGVGLAIVEKIVSKHGGRVWAKAEVGKGACFYFSLPEDL
jgi:light-regulated signal transduction histidine kinase (bacteriophytochrome)